MIGNGLAFRKSSYSAQQQECVEVAPIPAEFHKSSYSGGNNECVEVGHAPVNFRKSNYSGASENCVEVGSLACGAAMRDSKHPDAGHLPFPSSEWTGFLSAALR